jgi:hypothetical protein
MPKISYITKDFSKSSRLTIQRANEICEDFYKRGFNLTLRQLYYQFVSRGWIPNKDTEYKRLGSIINDARLAGLLDWNYIEDRTRNLRSLAHWDDPRDSLAAVASQYREDRWRRQPLRVEVWVEKDALVDVLRQACNPLDTPYFSCRGYTSQSEMWTAAQRFIHYKRKGQKVVVVHLGDHDPSGIDMSRDIEDRIRMFMNIVYADDAFELRRIALNMDQIQQYNPPPNPAKTTDARYRGYIDRYGDESWELDALDPQVLVDLITITVVGLRDEEKWREAEEDEDTQKKSLKAVYGHWNSVVDFMQNEDML